MSTCPTNPIVTNEGSRDTGFCQRDTKLSTDDGLTNKQRFSNMAKNPQITRSCEENVDGGDGGGGDGDDGGDGGDDGGGVPNIEPQRNRINIQNPTFNYIQQDIDDAMKLVARQLSISNTASELSDNIDVVGNVCHYKPIKF